MLDFDVSAKRVIHQSHGLYKRYSDDIIVVIPSKKKSTILEELYTNIQDLKLNIKKEKTQIFKFTRNEKGLNCAQEFPEGPNPHKKLSYLGFEYDGKEVLLKSNSLSRYQRKMQKAVRRGKFFAKLPKNPAPGELFKQRLFKGYSYKGAQRRQRWKYDKLTKNWKRVRYHDWGNFLTYVEKSAAVMSNPKIKRQVRKSWKQLNSQMNEEGSSILSITE